MMHHSPNIDLRGVQPQVFHGMDVLSEEYDRMGYDMYWTSAMRSGDDDSLHGYGCAGDGAARHADKMPEWVGETICKRVRDKLCTQYDVVWHKGSSGKWHHHLEFDPTHRGVAPYKEAENGHKLCT